MECIYSTILCILLLIFSRGTVDKREIFNNTPLLASMSPVGSVELVNSHYSVDCSRRLWDVTLLVPKTSVNNASVSWPACRQLHHHRLTTLTVSWPRSDFTVLTVLLQFIKSFYFLGLLSVLNVTLVGADV